MRLRKVFATSTTSVLFLQRQTQRQVWRNNVSRGHAKNKLFQVWLSEEDYRKFEEFLDKFSAGDTDAERRRQLFHWLAEQTQSLDQTILARRLKEAEEKRKVQEFHCLNGVMQAPQECLFPSPLCFLLK
jgi:hypothetical protein